MSLFDTTWSLQVEKLLPPVLRDRDFEVQDMDFKTGDALNNYIEYILISSPGHWKEFPMVGVGIYNYLQGTQSPQVLARAIRLHLEADIFERPLVDVSKFPTISVNAVTVELEQDGE
jgi:hypothetical protein